MGSDNRVSSSVIALQENKPLWDCCSGLNCSWLVEESVLALTLMKLLLTSDVLFSGPAIASHSNVATDPPVEHSKV